MTSVYKLTENWTDDNDYTLLVKKICYCCLSACSASSSTLAFMISPLTGTDCALAAKNHWKNAVSTSVCDGSLCRILFVLSKVWQALKAALFFNMVLRVLRAISFFFFPGLPCSTRSIISSFHLTVTCTCTTHGCLLFILACAHSHLFISAYFCIIL